MRKAQSIKEMAVCGLALATFSAPTLGQERQATALKTKEAITVDGRLEEPVWNEAVALSDFVQFEPERGRPASVRTVVRIVYDGRAIYFGFENHDPEPGRIAARLSKRDSDLTEDDSVAVCLDTYFDRRNSYYFLTNLLGTQYDGRITENGLTTDTTWDGIWKSAAVRTGYGWSAEVAVEFASLKYKPGEGRTWGLALVRVFPRRLESSFWQGEVESPYKVSQFGRLSGLDLEAAPKAFRAVPHVTTKVEEGEPGELEAGLDARYALSQLVSADLTVNPDFATVEADQEQVNLTRFELDLPEKRTFFLEGSEIYRQRITLFYSRRIGDIYAGAKVYGKSGGFEFSGLTAQTRPDDLSGTDSANFSVLRLKRDIFKSSTLGFLAANRLVNGRNQGTAGLDTSLYFTKTLQFTGQLAVSYGEHGSDSVAFFLRPSYDSATGHFHVRYTQLGKYFGDNANAVGFIRDDNRRELDSALEKTLWIKKGPFERLEYGSNYNIYWGTEGTLRSWQVDQGLDLDLRNKFSLAMDYTEEYKLFEKDFRNRQAELTLGYNTREWQSATLAYSFGRNFDLDFRLVEGRVNYRLGRSLTLEYALTRLVFNPDPEGETTWIHVLRATNYLSSDLFFKVFLQTNSAIDKFNLQVLFVYRFQPPFGLVQVAYQKGTARLGFRGTQGHTLFVKFAYMF